MSGFGMDRILSFAIRGIPVTNKASDRDADEGRAAKARLADERRAERAERRAERVAATVQRRIEAAARNEGRFQLRGADKARRKLVRQSGTVAALCGLLGVVPDRERHVAEIQDWIASQGLLDAASLLGDGADMSGAVIRTDRDGNLSQDGEWTAFATALAAGDVPTASEREAEALEDRKEYFRDPVTRRVCFRFTNTEADRTAKGAAEQKVFNTMLRDAIQRHATKRDDDTPEGFQPSKRTLRELVSQGQAPSVEV